MRVKSAVGQPVWDFRLWNDFRIGTVSTVRRSFGLKWDLIDLFCFQMSRKTCFRKCFLLPYVTVTFSSPCPGHVTPLGRSFGRPTVSAASRRPDRPIRLIPRRAPLQNPIGFVGGPKAYCFTLLFTPHSPCSLLCFCCPPTPPNPLKSAPGRADKRRDQAEVGRAVVFSGPSTAPPPPPE